jgi:response regulator RpfG family c-di-GMP phosphodiesterase
MCQQKEIKPKESQTEPKNDIEEIKEECIEEKNIIDTVNDIIKKELDTIQKMSMINIKNIKITKKCDINILYIEDNKIYFFLIKQILKKHYQDKINITWRIDLASGYKFIKENDVDLILLDRTLDDGLGDDLIYKLEAENYNIKKIILISVIDELTDVEKFNKMGLNYYIKPLKVQEFVKTMDIIFGIN